MEAMRPCRPVRLCLVDLEAHPPFPGPETSGRAGSVVSGTVSLSRLWWQRMALEDESTMLV